MLTICKVCGSLDSIIGTRCVVCNSTITEALDGRESRLYHR
jgi:hypothetical protein